MPRFIYFRRFYFRRFGHFAAVGVLVGLVVGNTVDASAQPKVPSLLYGTRAARGSTIHGNAMSPIDRGLSFVTVRLRDVRFGRIVDLTKTDNSGMFMFGDVEPSSYVVELMGNDQKTTLAASQILNVNSGEAVSVIVKLPFRVSQFSKVIGQTKASALTVLSAAAASGVLAAVVTGQPISPEQ